MKNAILCIIILFFSISSFSQVTTGSFARVSLALSLLETSDLHFGTMTKPTGNVDVTVTVNNTRFASNGNILLLSQSPTYRAAAYTVYGDKNDFYNVVLPNNNVVTITNGPYVMHINDFTCLTASGPQAGRSGKLNHLGVDTFRVGATLNLVGYQQPGIYFGTFNVTVAYD